MRKILFCSVFDTKIIQDLVMTPTLFGRWQTRILLLATVGLLVSLPFAIGLLGGYPSSVYFWILFYVVISGIIWDVIYDQIQKYRWDRDWPAIYQLSAGIWEGFFLGLAINILPLPVKPPLGLFLFHYSTVWLSIFIISQSLMRVIFIRWRFRGGQWL